MKYKIYKDLQETLYLVRMAQRPGTTKEERDKALLYAEVELLKILSSTAPPKEPVRPLKKKEKWEVIDE